eukprot:5892790-Prymnesium_polylepis.1
MRGGIGGEVGGAGGDGGAGSAMQPGTATPTSIHVCLHRVYVGDVLMTGGVQKMGQPAPKATVAKSWTLVWHASATLPNRPAAAPKPRAHSAPPVHNEIALNAPGTSEQPSSPMCGGPSTVGDVPSTSDILEALATLVLFVIAISASIRKCVFDRPEALNATSSPLMIRFIVEMCT